MPFFGFNSKKSMSRWLTPFLPISLCLLVIGYRFTTGGVLEYLTYYRVLIEGQWLPNDYWVINTSRIDIRTGYLGHIWVFEQLLGLKYAFLILFLVTLYALTTGLRAWAELVFQKLNIQLSSLWIAPVMVIPPLEKRFNSFVEGNNVFSNNLMASFMATPLVCWGIVVLLQRRYRGALFLKGLPWLLLVSVIALFIAEDAISRDKPVRPWEARWYSLELPGGNPQCTDRFFQKSKPLVKPNSVVLVPNHERTQFYVRLAWNQTTYHTRKTTPFADHLWPEFNIHSELLDAYSRNPTLKNFKKISVRQPVDYLVIRHLTSEFPLLLYHCGFYLYEIPEALK